MDQFTQQLLAAGNTTVNNLLLINYRAIGLTNEELLVYLQCQLMQAAGQQFPDMDTVATRLGTDSNTVYQWLHEMISKQLLTIDSTTAADGKINNRYDFSGIYDKLAALLKQSANQAVANQPASANAGANARAETFKKIEVEFGRPLSPMEMDFVSRWFDEDHYSAELIQLALREAVLNQAYSPKYMDRILLNWDKKHLTTPAQIDAENQRLRAQRQPKTTANQTKQTKGPEIPLFIIGHENEQPNQ